MQIYRESDADDSENPWLACENCSRWIHKKCFEQTAKTLLPSVTQNSIEEASTSTVGSSNDSTMGQNNSKPFLCLECKQTENKFLENNDTKGLEAFYQDLKYKRRRKPGSVTPINTTKSKSRKSSLSSVNSCPTPSNLNGEINFSNPSTPNSSSSPMAFPFPFNFLQANGASSQDLQPELISFGSLKEQLASLPLFPPSQQAQPIPSTSTTKSNTGKDTITPSIPLEQPSKDSKKKRFSSMAKKSDNRQRLQESLHLEIPRNSSVNPSISKASQVSPVSAPSKFMEYTFPHSSQDDDDEIEHEIILVETLPDSMLCAVDKREAEKAYNEKYASKVRNLTPFWSLATICSLEREKTTDQKIQDSVPTTSSPMEY